MLVLVTALLHLTPDVLPGRRIPDMIVHSLRSSVQCTAGVHPEKEASEYNASTVHGLDVFILFCIHKNTGEIALAFDILI
jgi:hypothetical protein